MLWLIYALAAAILNGIKIAIHRHVMKTESPYAYALFENIIAAIIFLPIFLIYFKAPSTFFPWALVLLSSIAWASIMPLVYYSHKYTEASLRAPINQIGVLFVFLLSMILLSEVLTIEKTIGTLLMLIGLIILSYHKEKIMGNLADKGVQLTLLSTFLVSLALIIDKKAIAYFPAEMYVFLVYFFPALFLTLFIKKRINQTKKLLKNKWPYAITVGILSTYYLFALKSYKLADISLVYPILRLSTLITMLIGFGFYKERKEILKRIIGAIIMIMGAAFIAGAFNI